MVLLLTPPGTEEKCFSKIFALTMDADVPPEAVTFKNNSDGSEPVIQFSHSQQD